MTSANFLLLISQDLLIVGQKISTILVRLQKRAQNGAQRYQEKFFEEILPDRRGVYISL